MKSAEPYDVTSEKKAVLLCEPHLISFMGILKHMHGEYPIAMTDGKTVWYGAEYTKMPQAQRAFVFTHELLHGIFRHSDRAMLIRLTQGMINPAIFNYAADAIINEGIVANPAMPSGMFMAPTEHPPIMMAYIHNAMKEAIAFTGSKPPSNYDPKAKSGQQVEIIYGWLMWALNEVKQSRQKQGDALPSGCGNAECEICNPQANDNDAGEAQGEGTPGDGNAAGEAANDDDAAPQQDKGKGKGKPAQGPGSNGKEPRPATQIENMGRDDAWDLQERLDEIAEMLDKNISASTLIDELEKRMSEARIKIDQIVQSLKLAGKGHGSMLLDMCNDLPKPTIRWEHVLRQKMNKDLGNRLDDSWSRHGSATRYALVTRAPRVPVAPGTTIFTDRPKVLLWQDVSGSMFSNLRQCFSEIWSIAKRKDATIDLATWDDGIQERKTIRNQRDFKNMLQLGIQGGGGTRINAQMILDAEKAGYRTVVIFTDGYVGFELPKRIKIGIVWVITADGTTKGLPHGTVVRLPQLIEGRAEKIAA